MIHLDTSALVDALTGRRRSLARLASFVDRGERIALSSIALYEWLRGPRTRAELQAQEALFPGANSVPFGPGEAVVAARLYRQVPRARGRELDLAIAACAIANDAALWTLNPNDFRDIPSMRLA